MPFHNLLQCVPYMSFTPFIPFLFQSPSRKDANVELFREIEKSLLSSKCWTKPSVYIQSEVDKELRNELKDIVKRHDGKVVGRWSSTYVENLFKFVLVC